MKVIFVVGPTASGKSDLALTWAEQSGGVIINCDSIQLFQSLDIGSAKPSKEDFKRVPHYLFDYLPEGSEMTAGEYSRDFFSVLKDLQAQNVPVAFVVGGTGFYFQAIEKGLYPIGAVDPAVMAQVEVELQNHPEALYTELLAKDPETAAKISPQDHYRLARAIEMMRTHGRPVSVIRKEFERSQPPFPHPLLKIGLRIAKEELLPRVRLRTRKMLQQGLVTEVQSLLQKGLKSWPALQSVGYRECISFLEGELSSEIELEDLIVQNTMRLAKKQRTWFQRDASIQWLTWQDRELGQKWIAEFLSKP